MWLETETYSLPTIALLSSGTLQRDARSQSAEEPQQIEKLKPISILLVHTALPLGPIIPTGPRTPPLP